MTTNDAAEMQTEATVAEMKQKPRAGGRAERTDAAALTRTEAAAMHRENEARIAKLVVKRNRAEADLLDTAQVLVSLGKGIEDTTKERFRLQIVEKSVTLLKAVRELDQAFRETSPFYGE